MVWTTRNESDKLLIKELLEQTDRGASLIAAAYLEERLTDAIKARLNRDEEIESRLFNGSGPLAAFSTKIDLGLLLGVYEPKARDFLHTIRRIRNEFAHNPQPRDFRSQKIHDLCKNIDLAVKATFDIHAPDGTTTHVDFELKPDGTPRTAFLNAVQFLLLFLDMEINVGTLRKPPPPVFAPFSTTIMPKCEP
jgi:hypothetical protein